MRRFLRPASRTGRNVSASRRRVRGQRPRAPGRRGPIPLPLGTRGASPPGPHRATITEMRSSDPDPRLAYAARGRIFPAPARGRPRTPGVSETSRPYREKVKDLRLRGKGSTALPLPRHQWWNGVARNPSRALRVRWREWPTATLERNPFDGARVPSGQSSLQRSELGQRDGNVDGNDGNRPPTPAHPGHRPTRPDIG
jgi:hypothetical protein